MSLGLRPLRTTEWSESGGAFWFDCVVWHSHVIGYSRRIHSPGRWRHSFTPTEHSNQEAQRPEYPRQTPAAAFGGYYQSFFLFFSHRFVSPTTRCCEPRATPSDYSVTSGALGSPGVRGRRAWFCHLNVPTHRKPAKMQPVPSSSTANSGYLEHTAPRAFTALSSVRYSRSGSVVSQHIFPPPTFSKFTRMAEPRAARNGAGRCGSDVDCVVIRFCRSRAVRELGR